MSKSRGFLEKLRQRLNAGAAWLERDLREFMPGRGITDEALLEDLETSLLKADVGATATLAIIEQLQRQSRVAGEKDGRRLVDMLHDILVAQLQPVQKPLIPDSSSLPFVILVIGVNGSGKTTTAAKLAKQFKDQGKNVMLAAGDTFRAAAIEQLLHWGAAHDIPVIAQQPGADSAAVLFDAHAAARTRHMDILVADTAGRLHTQDNLMAELQKVSKVLKKANPAAPQETLLVLDATTGQNALVQAQQFTAAMQVTGLAMTKLDGSARGGILFAVAKELGLPLRYIGIGEAIDDLGTFDAEQYVDALLAPTADSQVTHHDQV